VKLIDNLAYTETVHKKHGTDREYRIVSFNEEVTWHRSEESKKIHILSGHGWQLKLGDEMPIELEIGKDYQVMTKGECRLIKGRENLVIRIEELYQPQPRNPIL
jgi:hypothetical protein